MPLLLQRQTLSMVCPQALFGLPTILQTCTKIKTGGEEARGARKYPDRLFREFSPLHIEVVVFAFMYRSQEGPRPPARTAQEALISPLDALGSSASADGPLIALQVGRRHLEKCE